ncbi:MAG: hypothetical protein KKC75_00685 [Nanoarchaeota archaeon]|nr:hypothetical protein [Nanoarchaeota archaeon]MBU1004814.1 hypothetical protein [Nanoarchaeota archaeon]MBU1946613.1 hypothetical protein [Nanoarchaeota archaeon]
MRVYVMVLILLMVLPIALASVEVTSKLNREYNLGEDISLSVKIVSDKSANALVKCTLRCDDKDMLYYISPITVEKDIEINIDIPPIKTFSEGQCKIMAEAETLERDSLGRVYSDEFFISSDLEIIFTVDETSVLPGDTIKIDGTVTQHNEKVEKGNVFIVLDGKKEEAELKGGEFSYSIKLAMEIQSGEHKISILANDKYGNANEQKAVINVNAVPTLLDYGLNAKEFSPIDEFQINARILDQGGDLINDNIGIKLYKQKTLFGKEIILFDTGAESGKSFSFTFAPDTAPDNYKLKLTYGDLDKEDIITILPYSKIEIKLEGNTLFVKNTGNIDYNNKTNIMLEKDSETYVLEKRIKLKVGEETTIDLTKDLPAGTYSIKTELNDSETPVNVDKTFYKIGMGWVTGSVTAGADMIVKRPWMASLALLALISAIIMFFNREKLIKRKIEKYN